MNTSILVITIVIYLILYFLLIKRIVKKPIYIHILLLTIISIYLVYLILHLNSASTTSSYLLIGIFLFALIREIFFLKSKIHN